MIYNPSGYNEFYSTIQSKLENDALKGILSFYISNEETILDLGSGTGLLQELLPQNHIILSDPSPDMINFLKNKFDNKIYCLPAGKAIKSINADVVVSLFAMNYFSCLEIIDVLLMTRKGVFVVYNKPFLSSSNSVYRNQELLFKTLHNLKTKYIAFMFWLRRYKLKVKLCNQDHYWVYVL